MAFDKATQDILNAVDAEWNAIRAKFLTAQTDYAGKNSRCFQVLPTMTTAPADGATKAPDALNVKPGYQAEKPTDLASTYTLSWPQKGLLEVHQYVTPARATGFVMFLTVVVGGLTYRRAENVGPEAWRDAGWADVTPTGIP